MRRNGPRPKNLTARRSNPKRRAVKTVTAGEAKEIFIKALQAQGYDTVTADEIATERVKEMIAEKRRGNPSPRRAEEIEAAAKLQADFSGHEPGNVDTVKVPDQRVFTPVGNLDGVLYTTTRDGKVEKYIHRFRRKSRPLLATSHDGTQLRILGGEFRFTEAGIVDT